MYNFPDDDAVLGRVGKQVGSGRTPGGDLAQVSQLPVGHSTQDHHEATVVPL